MKHLLPILTAALALTAMTASASTTYTEYTQEEFFANQNYKDNFDQIVDSVIVEGHNGTYDFGSYKVILEDNSKLRIHVNEDIKLYVYDYVDNVQSDDNSASALTGVNATANKLAVQKIGYRKIVAGSDGTFVKTSNEKDEITHSIGDPTDTETVHRVKKSTYWTEEYDIVRNSYYLGEFKAGDYELFVSYAADGSDGKWSYTNTAGGYLIQTDKLMSANIKKEFLGNYDQDIYDLAQVYTPLAQVNNISFGLRSAPADPVVAGNPLPGGVQIALIAGVFGLGFWYVRRRKATVA